MPHIRIRSLEKTLVEKLSLTLTADLAKAISTSEDNFTIELISSEFFFNGKAVLSYPFVEVLWFDRTQDIKDQCAQIITNQIKQLSNAEDVVVVFRNLEKESYYENLRHF
jgi:hypothetical protein